MPGPLRAHRATGQRTGPVVQQRARRGKSNVSAKGVPVNDDAGLEREADILGAKAARSKAPAV